jgi:CO dehydrogenase nickel-insertion accessory protein CooC1
LALRIGGQYLVLNDVDPAEVGRIEAQAQQTGLELIGVVPSDNRLREFSRQGQPLNQLAPDSSARRALREILEAALSPTAAAL